MNVDYRFFIQFGETGAKHPVSPIYKDDLSLTLTKEQEQRFFRSKLNGRLSFVRNDYDYIMGADFATTFILTIEEKTSDSQTWVLFNKSQFHFTDCTINIDDKRIEVQPQPLDEYTTLLAGWEKEQDLIKLPLVTSKVSIYQRPIIQIYSPGEDIVSCFLTGLHWEQDITAEESRYKLINTYHFAPCSLIRDVTLRENNTGLSNINGRYVGKLEEIASDTTPFSGTLQPLENQDYYLVFGQSRYSSDTWKVRLELRRRSDNVLLYIVNNYNVSTTTFSATMLSADPSAVGTVRVSAQCNDFFARYILNALTLGGIDTYILGADDIVGDNRNYKRVIGYSTDIVNFSGTFSQRPTPWGIYNEGQYYVPPYTLTNDTFYPVGQSRWGLLSFWFNFSIFNFETEKSARTTRTINDCYLLASCIQTLINATGASLQHLPTAEYSEFLYGTKNPLTLQDNVTLFVTQKTNILRGEYRTPAQKAVTTLKNFLDMLAKVYQCYWFVENKKLRIEHVKWFKNGGTYSGGASVQLDLTQLYNAPNGKPWAFATSQYTYKKEDMPQRYQVKWMDDTSEAFEGFPIEIVSPYVSDGKIEDVNIGGFVSDIDLMQANPNGFSEDGLALLGATPLQILKEPAQSELDSGAVATSTSTGGLARPSYDIYNPAVGTNSVRVKLRYTMYYTNETRAGVTTFILSVYNGRGFRQIGAFRYFSNKQTFEEEIDLPWDTQSITIAVADGGAKVLFWSIQALGQLGVQIEEMRVNNTQYSLQNAQLSMFYLQPNYWLNDMPAKVLKVNNAQTYALGIKRNKIQTINFPVGATTINTLSLIKTYIGNGEIQNISVNLSSKIINCTLNYDTE